MSSRKDTGFYEALQCKRGICRARSLELIGEEPLLIRIDEKPYSVVMRTPGQEVFHAAGFCLGEGIADTPDDFMTLGYDRDLEPNIVDIWLTPARLEKIQPLLARRSYVSQTSCGICGKQMIEELNQVLIPARDTFKIEINRIFDCINKLSDNQNYYQTTRGSHAAIIFNDSLEMISFAEDVGRHNALDKAIGNAFMNKKLSRATIVVLSSRISYELVQKATRAGLPMMISNSRPTALAAEMGQALNMTLACPGRESELIVVCGADRIVKQKFT